MRRPPALCGLFLLATLAGLITGCAPRSELRVTAYDDPYFPDTESLVLNDCVFRESETGDLHLVGRAQPDALTADGTNADRLVHLQVFWRPRPGKTFDDPSTADAVIRYARAVGDGRVEYSSGTGFVYPTRSRWTGRLSAAIESGRLVVAGDGAESNETGRGPLRLVGRLTARPDGPAAIALIRQMDRLESQARVPRVAGDLRP